MAISSLQKNRTVFRRSLVPEISVSSAPFGPGFGRFPGFSPSARMPERSGGRASVRIAAQMESLADA